MKLFLMATVGQNGPLSGLEFSVTIADDIAHAQQLLCDQHGIKPGQFFQILEVNRVGDFIIKLEPVPSADVHAENPVEPEDARPCPPHRFALVRQMETGRIVRCWGCHRRFFGRVGAPESTFVEMKRA